MQQITLSQPDDWHLHLREGLMLKAVVTHSARRFSRAVIMPNLKPPVTTVAMAMEYRRNILSALPQTLSFQPYMALYLTETTPIEEVKRAAETAEIIGFKLYPAGATTHSESGVSRMRNIYPVLEAMEQFDVPLLVHGEVTDPNVDIFDRERVFMEKHLLPVIEQFPALRVVVEHATTREAVQLVEDYPDRLAATITVHHLLYNRNALFIGGIRPHYYCLPILKREVHRQALLAAATSGNPRFFLGTDSAPHSRSSKESVRGCAGCFTAPAALELYAEIFDRENRIDKLEQFASFNGADFYRLPRNQGTVTLKKSEWKMPADYSVGNEVLVPLRAGHKIVWALAD